MDQIERELKKRQIEQLDLMGFKVNQISQLVNLSRQTVHVLRKEINTERLKQHKHSNVLIDEIITNYKRLLEEAWVCYQKGENNAKAGLIREVRGVLNDRLEKLVRLGYIKAEPQKIDITSGGDRLIDETEIFNYLNKLARQKAV